MDNAATTPVLPEVRDIMIKVMEDDFGNPSSKHTKGMIAERYITEAKETIASILKCAVFRGPNGIRPKEQRHYYSAYADLSKHIHLYSPYEKQMGDCEGSHSQSELWVFKVVVDFMSQCQQNISYEAENVCREESRKEFRAAYSVSRSAQQHKYYACDCFESQIAFLLLSVHIYYGSIYHSHIYCRHYCENYYHFFPPLFL